MLDEGHVCLAFRRIFAVIDYLRGRKRHGQNEMTRQVILSPLGTSYQIPVHNQVASFACV